ncbi:hypothetical protein GGI42DRAFT_343939 [Trichoderma sp. SZMC 28013]
MPLWAGPAFVPICCPPKCLRACHDLVHNLVQPLSTPTSPPKSPEWGNPQPASRKELQPQPAVQPQSGPLASEAFLDRQRTGGLWAQRAQQLRCSKDASARPTSDHGRAARGANLHVRLLDARLSLQQGAAASLASLMPPPASRYSGLPAVAAIDAHHRTLLYKLLRHSHPRARSFASAPSETLLGALACLWLVLEP